MLKFAKLVLVVGFVGIALIWSAPVGLAENQEAEEVKISIEEEIPELVQIKSLHKEGKPEEAMALIEEALKKYPKSAELHAWKGIVSGALAGKAKGMGAAKYGMQMMTELDKALELDPDNVTALMVNAQIKLATPPEYGGDIDSAIHDFKRILELSADTGDVIAAHFSLGMAYKKKNELENAREEFQKVLELKPDHQMAKAELEGLGFSEYAEIRNINIKGNKVTKEKMILNLLTFKQGNRLNLNELQRSREKLMEAGLFLIVSIAPIATVDMEKVDINIELRESPNLELLQYPAIVKYNNFLGTGQKIGLEIDFFTDDPDQVWRRGLQIIFAYQNPWFIGNSTSLDVNGYYSRNSYRIKGNSEILAKYKMEIFGVDLGLTYTFNDYLSISGGFSISRPNVYKTDWLVDIDLPIRLLYLIEDGVKYINTISSSVTWDGRDNQERPTKGVYVEIKDEVSPSWLGSDYSFNKLMLITKGFLSLKTKNVFGARIKLGTSSGSIPHYKQFFTGSYTGLRGYAFCDYIGYKMFLTNIEYRRKILDLLRGIFIFDGVLFFDFGRTWMQGESLKFDNLAHDYGLGIRFHSFPGNAFRAGLNFCRNNKGKNRFYLTIMHPF
jgi:TPR repeat protein